MRRLLVPIILIATPLQAQIAEPIDPLLWKQIDLFHNAKHSILCSQVNDWTTDIQQKQFSDLAIELLREFVVNARDPDFELPEYNPILSPVLVAAIDAPSVDFAVGKIFSDLDSTANVVVQEYVSVIETVEVEPMWKDLSRFSDRDVIRLFGCDGLFPLLGLVER